MVSGSHLNRKGELTAAASVLGQVPPALFLTLSSCLSERVKIMLEMELSLSFFSLKKKESIIGSAFKSHLCRLNLGLS